LFRISSIVARTSKNRFSFAERTTLWPSSEEESDDPARKYFEGPASESDPEEEEEEEEEDPDPDFFEPADPDDDDELDEESESLPEESSPPQNLEACARRGRGRGWGSIRERGGQGEVDGRTRVVLRSSASRAANAARSGSSLEKKESIRR
jgi:hypothetical protein